MLFTRLTFKAKWNKGMEKYFLGGIAIITFGNKSLSVGYTYVYIYMKYIYNEAL